MSRRYVIRALGDNRAALVMDSGVERCYWAPSGGGYVRRVTDTRPGTLGTQVCEGLAESGCAPEWIPGRGNLADLLRREARKRVGSEQIDYMRAGEDPDWRA